MKQFMLLMKGDDSKQASPEEMQQRMQGYMAWMKKMMSENRLRAGQPLEPTGKWLKKDKTGIPTNARGPAFNARKHGLLSIIQS